MIEEDAIKAMDDMAAWGVAHIERPSVMAPDVKTYSYGAWQQSLARRYRAAGTRAEFTRADKIIASAQLDSSEIGTLRGEVRRLCDEIDAMSNPNVSPDAVKFGETWGYVDVRAGEDFGHALVRCFYDNDKDGDGEMRAVYMAGFAITQALSPEAYVSIESAMQAERSVAAEADGINAAIGRAES